MRCRQIIESSRDAAVPVLQDDFRLVDIMSLHEVESELKQDRHGVGIFDAFRDGLDIALASGFDDLADCRLHGVVRHQRVHEFAVDLDVVGLEQIEDLEAFLAYAVVLDRKADAELVVVAGVAVVVGVTVVDVVVFAGSVVEGGGSTSATPSAVASGPS